jgi:predicted amidohydrolase
VEFLVCPEAILGGLADYADKPAEFALNLDNGSLAQILKPLTSNKVTTIVGFTESDPSGRLYNSAAVFHQGSVVGVYRKHHPAINRSVYSAGSEAPIFRIGALTFGVIICRDSAYVEPAQSMVTLGARALFVPSNTALPTARAYAELVRESRDSDIARAIENRVPVVRADVAGHTTDLLSYGATGIADRNGIVIAVAESFQVTLVIAEIDF